ncbi:MAG: outer membrane beta-barrel protein [Flavobacteriales bacterium]|nr:outer membrane beta-barrel protein [Flavobacteriales bacterium]
MKKSLLLVFGSGKNKTKNKLRVRKLLWLAIFAIAPFIVFGQSATVKGRIKDVMKEPIPGILVTAFQDSKYVGGSRSDDSGVFILENLPQKVTTLKFKYLGYQDLQLNIEVSAKNMDLGVIVLKTGLQNIPEVVIEAQSPTATLSGDTSEYQADSYKTNPDASAEDLIKKMPSISENNGKLQAEGEDVKKVLVDGKPFFGDDPSVVLKNLPAEVIQKIQIYDQASDQSQASGFDDGNTSKTINIVTKLAFRNGTFGRVVGGAGDNDKWKLAGNLNRFKDKKRMTLLLNANNINEQNFLSDDLLGVVGTSSGNSRGGGGRGRGSGGQGTYGDVSNFLIDQSNGISKTHASGLNYSDTWKNLDFTGSYFVNRSKNLTTSRLNRQYYNLEDAGIQYVETGLLSSTNLNHRANLQVEWKNKSNDQITFKPNITFQTNSGTSGSIGINGSENLSLNTIQNDQSTTFEGYHLYMPLLMRKNLKKKGRVVSLYIKTDIGAKKGNSDYTYDFSFTEDSASNILNSLNAKLDQNERAFSGQFTYTEPVTKNSQVNVSYEKNISRSNSDLLTTNLSNQTEKIDSALSSYFNSMFHSDEIKLAYRYSKNKVRMDVRIAYQKATLNNSYQYPEEGKIKRPFTSFLPGASLQYKFSQNSNIMFRYRTSNNIPSVSQLQEVIVYNNPTMLYSGNSGLKQSFENNFSLRYKNMNRVKNTVLFAYIGSSIYQNATVNNSFIAREDTFLTNEIPVTKGSQVSTFQNLNGKYNLRAFVNYTFPLKKLKSKMNLALSSSIGNSPSVINDQVNNSFSQVNSLNLSLNSTISSALEIILNSKTLSGSSKNSIQTSNNNRYLNQNSSFKLNYIYKKKWLINADLNHNVYSGLSNGLQNEVLMLNLAAAYKFLKDQRAELRFLVFDVFNQNNVLNRVFTENYFEDSQTNILKRYFMATFTYNIKYFQNSEKQP